MIKKNNQSFSFKKGTTVIGAIIKAGQIIYEAFKNLLISGIPPLTLTKCKGTDLVDYKIYGNSEQEILPNEYQQIEYIESTGTQYIDTGIIPNQDTGFDIVFLTKNALTATDGKFGSIMGTRESSGVKELQLTTYSVNSQGTLRYNNNSLTAGLIANAKMHCTLRDKKYTNNIDISHALTDTFESPVSLTIFALNQNGTKTQHGSLQIFSLKLYDGDTLTRDYIPCYRKSDNAIGLYDLVEDKFYVNQGTGTFLKGNKAPTPETPIEIESVGDKTKNLFNIKETEKYYGGLNCEVIDDVITLEATGTLGAQMAVNYVKNLDATKQYTISFKGKKLVGGGEASWIYVAYYGSNGDDYTLISYTTERNPIIGQEYSFNYKLTGYSNYAFYIYNYVAANAPIGEKTQYYDMQFEEGSTLTEYEPYGYKIPVKARGKNLLDLSQDLILWNTIKLEDNQSFQCAINNQYYAYIKINSLNDYLMEQKGKKITFSISEGIPNKKLSIVIYGKRTSTTNQFQEVSNDWGERSVTITIATDFTEITGFEMRFNRASTPFTDTTTIITGLQLELGEVTPYEPYQEPATTNIYLDEPLRKIGDYTDYIDFENKKVVRNIGEKLFDGTETIKMTTLNGINLFYTYDADYKQQSYYGFCNYYINNTNVVDNCFSISDAIYFKDNSFTTADEFKIWLSENNLILDFILRTSTEETIELPNIPTLKGTTIIEVDTKIQPSNMEVIYKGKP